MGAAQAGSGATLDFLKELVASSIESDDVGPLVKTVFEVVPAGEPLPLPIQRGSESATTSQSQGELPQGSVLDSVLELLQEVAEEKEAEIQQICRANATEISSGMHELGAMQRETAALRQQLLSNNAALQAAGTSLAGRLEEVQEVAQLQHKVADAKQAVSIAVQVLHLCAKAAKYIEDKQLYKAYKTLEAVQRDHGMVLRGTNIHGGYLPLLPLSGSGGGGAGSTSREGTPLKAAAAGTVGGVGSVGASMAAGTGISGGDAAGGADQLGPLAGFLREKVAELVALLEQRAVADFNNWLANVRAQARTIGMRAIRWAAAERQQEEALTRQRKLLLPRLEGLQDLREAGALVANSLYTPGLREAPPATPLPLPAAVAAAKTGSGGATPAAPTAPAASGSGSPALGSSPGSSSTTAARLASFKAARQAAGSSPTRAAGSPGSAAATSATPPGTAASSSGRPAAAAAAPAAVVQTPPQQQQPQVRDQQSSYPLQSSGTGDLLEGVDMAPLHRCVHIHSCLGRLHQFAEYYAHNRRQQLSADLALHQGDFLGQYQSYLTQLVGFFLMEDAVQERAAGTAGEPLDIVAQVDASWDAAVAALKAVLERAFQGATAAAAMLTVKDFLLLFCLALDHCGYQTVAVREVLMNSRAKYHELLAEATATTVQAAVSGGRLVPLEVVSQARAEELFCQLALPPTFRAEDAENKRPPFKAPFSSMVPELVRAIRGHIVDSVAYLKGLLTAGEVVPAARQYRDRMLARVVVAALQHRVDAAAGDRELPVSVGLQLVANVAALMHALPTLDDLLVAQARGETPETTAAAAAAATAATAAAAAAGSRSPSPGRRSRSRSHSPVKRPAMWVRTAAAAAHEQEQEPGEEAVERGRSQQQQGEGTVAAEADGSPCHRSPSRGSSHGSAPCPSPSLAASPTSLPAPATAASSPPSGSHLDGNRLQLGQQGHTVLSFGATSRSPTTTTNPAAAGGAAAAFHTLLASTEALVVQCMAAHAASLLSAGEQLDWEPVEQPRSTAYSPHVDELIMYLKECASLLRRSAPGDSVERMLRGVLHYLADALMLQLMSDAIPAFNIFGLQRLYSDLGGLSRTAGSLGVPGLADELAEPLLFCELMVFGSLEDVLKPEQRGPGGRLAAQDLRRLALVLGKYKELDKSSAFKGMHKSKQAERFISRKTVDRVVKELREQQSRPTSRASSSAGSFTLSGGGGGGAGGFTAAAAGGGSRGNSFITVARSG